MRPRDRRFNHWWLVCVFAAAARVAVSAEPDCAIRLVDVTAESRIAFRHVHGGAGQNYLPEFMVAGLALFDYDGDGLTDIYFLNGAPLKGTPSTATPRNALYRNNGDWTFTDVTAAAGVGDTGHGLGVAAADYDNDGDEDLYVANFGLDVLYLNNGDGTFSDATQRAGVAASEQFGAGVSFLDIEGDGDLDLYVANYVDFTYERHAELVGDAFPYPPGPRHFPAIPDILYRNDGDGTFTDVSQTAGISAVAGPAMGVISADYDDDGDADVFVCNDGAPNFLFQNDGRGRFQEAAVLSGLAYDLQGTANGSMGVDCGDYDNDGKLDFFVTGYTGELPVLYRNLGGGLFDDATRFAGAGRSAFPHTNWGAGLVDFDSDGDRDLLIACGHFLENIADIDDSTAYRTPNLLLLNEGGGRFADVPAACAGAGGTVESSRGAAFDDLDNDGDVDAVILNAGAAPTLLRNESPVDHHWLQVRLHGVRSNRQGVGARVLVDAGGRTQIAEVHSGRGYQSHYGSVLHFGLGATSRVDRLEIRWPGGRVDTRTNIEADTQLRCVETSQ